MEITNIKIRKVENHAKIAAVVSVTFDDVFVVNDIKVIYGTKGIFAAMPSRIGVVNGEERHMDIARHGFTIKVVIGIMPSIGKIFVPMARLNQ